MAFLDLFSSGIGTITEKLTSGVSSIIKDFKADPTKVIELESHLEELKIQAQEASEKLQNDLQQAYLKDIDSARNREIQIVTSEHSPLLNKIIQPILGLLILGSCFVFWYMILFANIPKEHEIQIAGITGSLTTLSMGVVGYYFGSSTGSAAKQKQLEQMQNNSK